MIQSTSRAGRPAVGWTPAPFSIDTVPRGESLLFGYQIGDPSLEWPVAYGIDYVDVDEDGTIRDGDGAPVSEVKIFIYAPAKLP